MIDCGHAGLVADCSTLMVQRQKSSTVRLMSAPVVAGYNQCMQIVAVDELVRCPLGRRALVNMLERLALYI